MQIGTKGISDYDYKPTDAGKLKLITSKRLAGIHIILKPLDKNLRKKFQPERVNILK